MRHLNSTHHPLLPIAMLHARTHDVRIYLPSYFWSSFLVIRLVPLTYMCRACSNSWLSSHSGCHPCSLNQHSSSHSRSSPALQLSQLCLSTLSSCCSHRATKTQQQVLDLSVQRACLCSTISCGPAEHRAGSKILNLCLSRLVLQIHRHRLYHICQQVQL